jgi:hypothetical protein
MPFLRAAIHWLACPPARAFLFIFLVAFSIRAIALTRVPESWITPSGGGQEDRIAVSLIERGEYSSTYKVPTGPTAHVPPLYPFLISLGYRLFGLTLTAGYLRWLVDIAIVSAAYAMLPWLAARFGLSREGGLLAGIAGALHVQWFCTGEFLAAIVLALLLVSFLRRWTGDRSSIAGSLAIGVASGAALHLNPALLPVFLGCAAFELWWRRDRRNYLHSALAVVGMILACVPWAWRNWNAFDSVFFIRSNFGLELRVGNHPGAAADVNQSYEQGTLRHPEAQIEEAILVRELGEIEYMRRARGEAIEWIRAHPTEYLSLCLGRFAGFWFGSWYRPLTATGITLLTLLAALGAWKTIPALSIPQRAALIIPLLAFPVVYYLVSYEPRYRLPIVWILLLFSGASVWQFIRGPENQAQADARG